MDRNLSNWDMKIYVVLIEDRHADVDIELYADRLEAIKRSTELAKRYSRRSEDIEVRPLNDAMKQLGWIRHISYSCESDYVTVIERDVNE